MLERNLYTKKPVQESMCYPTGHLARQGVTLNIAFERTTKALSTLSQKSATVAEFGDCRCFLPVFGDIRTFLRQCGQRLTLTLT